MTTMIIDEIPLRDLFIRLRQSGLPLGINDYLALIQALQCGFGLPDRAALVRLCNTLWTSSRDEQELLHYHFDQIIGTIPEGPSVRIVRPPETEHSPLSSDPLITDMSPRQEIVDEVGPLVLSLNHDLSVYRMPQATPPRGLTPQLDEVQLARTQTGDDLQLEALPSIPLPAEEFYPVTRRQMKQMWRVLRRPVREGPRTELDVEATVQQIGRVGVFDSPVLIPRRLNKIQLLLLVDRTGSMSPFHIISDRLVTTAQRGGRLDSAGTFYFHNVPDEILYRDPTLVDYTTRDRLLADLHPERAAVLIFSDAGASRGRRTLKRVEPTINFLKILRARVRRIVWLNPAPAQRWKGTAAELIAQQVPMFTLSRRGFQAALDVLRGRRVVSASQIR